MEEYIVRRRQEVRAGFIIKIALGCEVHAKCIVLVLAYGAGPWPEPLIERGSLTVTRSSLKCLACSSFHLIPPYHHPLQLQDSPSHVRRHHRHAWNYLHRSRFPHRCRSRCY